MTMEHIEDNWVEETLTTESNAVPRISLLSNTVHFFLGMVMIIERQGKYALAISPSRSEAIEFIRDFNSPRGAKLFFTKNYGHRHYALNPYNQTWTPWFKPTEEWILNFLKPACV